MKIYRPKPRAICILLFCTAIALVGLRIFYSSYVIYEVDHGKRQKSEQKVNDETGPSSYDYVITNYIIDELGSAENTQVPALGSKEWNDQLSTKSNQDQIYQPLQPEEQLNTPKYTGQILPPKKAESNEIIDTRFPAGQILPPEKAESDQITELIDADTPATPPEQQAVLPRPKISTVSPQKPPFIPTRRIVHLDLKGAPPKVEYFQQFFRLISRLGATGILIEWEDTFPYTGELEDCKSGHAYSEDDVRNIFDWAKENNLEIIPLVQTFGHLEWVLKHEKFAHLREIERYAQVICLSNPDAINLVKNIIDQVISFHLKYENGLFFHMGADEAFQVGMCQKCSKAIKEKYNGTRDILMLDHIKNIAQYVRDKYGRRVLMWHDMLDNVRVPHLNSTQIGQLVEPVIWCYAEDVNAYFRQDQWQKFSNSFPYIWGASAFKGADGPDRYHSNILHYMKNHETWSQAMTDQHTKFTEFRGIILTGWQRFDHFAILCELLPVGIPSLAINLKVIMNGGKWDQKIQNETSTILGCTYKLDPNSRGAQNCQFPGSRAYQQIQRLWLAEERNKENVFNDYMIRGWLSQFNIKHNYSSAWYTDKIIQKITMAIREYASYAKNIRVELEKIFHQDTVDEFIMEYIDGTVEKLLEMNRTASGLGALKTFPARPFQIKLNNELYDRLVVTPGPVKDQKRLAP